MELKWCSAHRMAECQSSGVKSLSRCTPLDGLGHPSRVARDPAAATSAVGGVTYNRMANVLKMHPYLVGSPGMQLESQEVDDLETRHHTRLRPGWAAPR